MQLPAVAFGSPVARHHAPPTSPFPAPAGPPSLTLRRPHRASCLSPEHARLSVPPRLPSWTAIHPDLLRPGPLPLASPPTSPRGRSVLAPVPLPLQPFAPSEFTLGCSWSAPQEEDAPEVREPCVSCWFGDPAPTRTWWVFRTVRRVCACGRPEPRGEALCHRLSSCLSACVTPGVVASSAGLFRGWGQRFRGP